MRGIYDRRNVWNPNYVIAAEQTLVLLIRLQTVGSVCAREKEAKRRRKLNESGKLRVKQRV